MNALSQCRIQLPDCFMMFHVNPTMQAACMSSAASRQRQLACGLVGTKSFQSLSHGLIRKRERGRGDELRV